jgi:hypothetical protein|tara:strand:- start:389 stop:670 length:282 start_codon:yes stop_codon:yes gene_type:complete
MKRRSRMANKSNHSAANEAEYLEFIANIDVSVAGKDSSFGDLRWHVDCSAINNIDDSLPEDCWAQALETAKMLVDCWREFYPQLQLTDEEDAA